MQVDAIQLGVYAFASANVVIAAATLPFILVGHRHRAVATALAVWRWLWKLAGVYAGLTILVVGIPASIHPLSPTTETVLSIACLAATAPTWWLFHRLRRHGRARRDATRAIVHEAAATIEHAARVRHTGRVRIG